MYNRNDPRFRRRINQLTQNLESANSSAQVGLFSLSQHYLKPCFASLSHCLEPCVASVSQYLEPCTSRCFPLTAEEQGKRQRQRAKVRGRGRPEYSFDFYDDWEEDEGESDALLVLDEGAVEDVVLGNAEHTQPGRKSVMAYGTRDRADVIGNDGGRNKTKAKAGKRSLGMSRSDRRMDPAVLPPQSRLGFLTKLPYWIGGGTRQGLKYKPSAADLQEHPQRRRSRLDAHDYSDGPPDHASTPSTPSDLSDTDDNTRRTLWPRTNRERSTTTGSGHTTDSYSSRGDIFPSDDEVEDAIPLDDEFAMVLERRTTGDGEDMGRNKRPSAGTRTSTRTASSRSSRKERLRDGEEIETQYKGQGSERGEEFAPVVLADGIDHDEEGDSIRGRQQVETERDIRQSIVDLKEEEQQAQREEEGEIAKRRDAAMRLAREKGLEVADRGDDRDDGLDTGEERAPDTGLARPP